MKKISLLLFILLIGCSKLNLNSSSSYTSSSTISSSSIISSSSETEDVFTSDSNSSSSISSLSSIELNSSSSSLSSSKLEENIDSIKKIKEKAQDFKGLENSVGVYESSISVKLNLKLLACLDAITTKSGYGDRYKILMSDGQDYIYLKTSYENYSYLKNYVQDQGVYTI